MKSTTIFQPSRIRVTHASLYLDENHFAHPPNAIGSCPISGSGLIGV